MPAYKEDPMWNFLIFEDADTSELAETDFFTDLVRNPYQDFTTYRELTTTASY